MSSLPRQTPNSGPTGPFGIQRPNISRRVFLERLILASAGTAGAGWLAACTSGQNASGTSNTIPVPAGAPAGSTQTGRLAPGHISDRILVVVDLQGGNDGLSTVIPASDPTYWDLRPNLAIDEDDLLPLNDRLALNPELHRLHQRGLTVVEGVGPIDGDLSHFAMTERWERGDAKGTENHRTGFLGRLVDTLDTGQPLVGASLSGPTPYLVSDQAATLSLDGLGSLWFLDPVEWTDARAYQRLIGEYSALTGLSPTSEHLTSLVPDSYERLIDLASKISSVDESEIDWEDPMLTEGGEIGAQLFLAADLIAADVGTRVIYTSFTDFDTHSDHQWRHPYLMSQFDVAVDGFLDRIDEMGMSDYVTVATVSEFGRRAAESGQGLDHGVASSMLVMGPGEDQVLGVPSPLDELDQDGNQRTTVSFDQYFATLAQDWLGIEAGSVLPGDPGTLGLLAA